MPLRVGDIETVASIRFDDRGADKYERRTRAMRADSRKDIEVDARVDYDSRGAAAASRGFKGVSREADAAERSAGRMRRGLGSIARGAGLAGLALGGGLVLGAKSAADGLARIETIGAQTDAALKSTGNAANTTRGEIESMAGVIERLTSVEAEAVQAGANLLLTFTGIRNEAGKGNDVFDQTTRAAVDMSVAMGTDVKNAAMQLGKALNDPEKGMTRLQRSGIMFTEQQKDQIRTLQESGDKLGAQKIILAEVNKEFGKSGEALGRTFTGQLRIAQHELGAVGEAALTWAMPGLKSAATATAGFLREMQEGTGAGGRFRDRMEAIGGTAVDVASRIVAFGRRVGAVLGQVIEFVRRNQLAFEILAGAIGGLVVVRTITRLFAAFRTALALATLAQMRFNLALRANPIGIVVTVLALLAGALVTAYKRSETFRDTVDEAFRKVKSVAGDAVSFVLRRFDDYLGGISSIASAMGKLPGPLGKPFRSAAGHIDRARERIRKLADEADALGNKKIKPVTVRVNLALGPGRKEYRPGDGWGVEDAVRDLARREGGKLDPSSVIGSIGLGGAATGGTGLTAFNHLAPRFGVSVGSGIRPGAITDDGNVSNHARGRARDFPGPPANMMRFALYLAQKYGSRLLELIYTPLGFSIKNGRRVPPFAQADHYDHVHVAMRHGGKVGPTSGGMSVRVAGEGSKDEWIVSQEGDKRANIGYAIEALQTLTGRNVAFYRRGGKHKGSSLGAATARVARGERGIVAADQRIERLEREYQQADRRFNLTAEEFITEDAAGVAHLDKAAIAARASDLQALYAKRAEIRQWLRILRDRVRRLIAVMKVAIGRLTRAGETGKKSRRAGYREQASEIRGRRDQLVDRERLMDLDIVDADLDLAELGNERASVLGTALPPAAAAPAAAPSVADPAGATDPAPAAPTAEQIAEAAAAQFAAFQTARQELFGSFGGNMAARGSDPYATPTGAAAGAQFFGAVPAGTRAVAGAGGRVTYIEAAEFNSHFASGPPSGDTFVQQQQREVQVGFS